MTQDNVYPFRPSTQKGQDKRRTGNGTGTSKEQRTKQRTDFATPSQVETKRDRMVNELCAKMYQQEYHEKYPSRMAFCLEYGGLVVNRRRVMDPEDRAILVDGLLTIAEYSGRVEVISRGRREFIIRLSDAERDAQKRADTKSGQKRDKYWTSRPNRGSGQKRAGASR